MKLKDYSYDVDYTWMKTRSADTDGKEYDLLSPAGRRLYFNAKIGDELEKLREFLDNNTFIAYLLAPKLAGKGTYTGMLMEAVGSKYFEVVSVGDLVRDYQAEFNDKGKDADIYKYMKENYRGMMDLDEAFDAFVGSNQKKLAPTEFILSLIKGKIDEIGHKTIFLDGFPRKADQLAYSLYFRELINYREDPDFFVLINLPLAVIDARLKGRRMCPKCRTSRNIQLLPTTKVNYDEDEQGYYLVCDNPECESLRMEAKKGDDKGLDLIKERIENDLELVQMARNMYGIPKIELFNSLQKDKADLYVEEYEVTKEYVHNHEGEEVTTEEKPFTVEVDGTEYYSLLPAPVIVQYVRQLCHLFRLD
jgi:adenylate kinase family enzyme